MRYEYFNSYSMDLDIDLYYCGYEDVAPDFKVGYHTRDCYLIHYIEKGEGFYVVNKQVYPVNEGDIFCIFPGDIISYYTNPENPWSFYWFSFNGRKALSLLSNIGISRTTLVRNVLDDNIASQISNLLEIFHSNQSNNIPKRLGSLYLIFGYLEESYKKSENLTSAKNSSSDYIEKTIQYISCNYHKKLTISDISRYVGLERTYFSKLFHKCTGISPQNYIMKYRIEKSIQLLKTTDMNISEVCECVGIKENYYFSRVFKSITGSSPKKYREVLRNCEAI